MTYIFLASPYTDEDWYVQQARFVDAAKAATWIAQHEGRAVYAPIVHWHSAAEILNLPTDAKFWQNQNSAMIASSAEVWVLTIPGWKTSKGVASEILLARAMCKPILYLHPPEESGEYYVREQP